MTTPQQWDHLIGLTATDADDGKIGTVGQVYLDERNGEPAWVTVSTGMFGSRESFAPLYGSSVRGDRLVLAVSRQLVKDAPSIDADGHLSEAEGTALYQHYAAYLSSPEADGAQGADTEGYAGRHAEGLEGTATTDDAMTRSEERLRVGTENVETGRARRRFRRSGRRALSCGAGADAGRLRPSGRTRRPVVRQDSRQPGRWFHPGDRHHRRTGPAHIAANVVNAILYAALAALVGIAVVAVGGGGIKTMSQRWDAVAARYDEEKPNIAPRSVPHRASPSRPPSSPPTPRRRGCPQAGPPRLRRIRQTAATATGQARPAAAPDETVDDAVAAACLPLSLARARVPGTPSGTLACAVVTAAAFSVSERNPPDGGEIRLSKQGVPLQKQRTA